MSASSAAEVDGRNRREFFRINDRVALSLRVITEREYREARRQARDRNERHSALSAIVAACEGNRAALRAVRDQSPAVAHYLEEVDDRIRTLARLMAHEDNRAPDKPTHDVNISGTGIRFAHDAALPRGTHVELDLQLFPSRTCLRLHGTVARSDERPKPSRDGKRATIAVDYSRVPDRDREQLIKHIHALQLDYVRRGAKRD